MTQVQFRRKWQDLTPICSLPTNNCKNEIKGCKCFGPLKTVSHTYLHTPTLILCITSIFLMFQTFSAQFGIKMCRIWILTLKVRYWWTMVVITSPWAMMDPQIHVEFRNQSDPGQGLKLTKLTKLISYCWKHVS